MSATVTVLAESGHLHRRVEVPKANGFAVDDNGWLNLRTSSWGGDTIALFKQWDEVVIEPDRGPDGRFVKKGS